MKNPRPITKPKISEALKQNRVWDLANKVLYDLCSKHPFHNKDDEIIAKVWLIGRSYSAAIERRKNKREGSNGGGFYEKEVGPKIRRSEIDKWFARLKKEPASVVNAIEIHHKLTKLFQKMTELGKRSLASKYLHFHFKNLFFIYDSRSAASLRGITPRSDKQLGKFSSKNFQLKKSKSDKTYANFFRRCLWLQEDLKKLLGYKPSPRELDKLFLHITGSGRT